MGSQMSVIMIVILTSFPCQISFRRSSRTYCRKFVKFPSNIFPIRALKTFRTDSKTVAIRDDSVTATSLSAYVENHRPNPMQYLAPINMSWSGSLEDVSSLVLHEDELMIVMFKPPSVLVQSDVDGVSDNLFDATLRYCLSSSSSPTTSTEPSSSSSQSSSLSPVSSSSTSPSVYRKKTPSKGLYLVHRLDRPVSGVVVFAKTPRAADALSRSFRRDKQSESTASISASASESEQDDLAKCYLCVVNGDLMGRDGCRTVQGGNEERKGGPRKTLRARLLVRKALRSSGASGGAGGAAECVGSDTDVTDTDTGEQETADNSVELHHLIQKTKAERVKCYDILRTATSQSIKADISDADNESGHNKAKTQKEKPPSNTGKSNTKQQDLRQRKDLVDARLRYKPLLSIVGGSGDKQTTQTLLHVELLTGRKHQIRAQLSHIGHPIVGDVKYGAPQAFKQRDIALHAYSLSIPLNMNPSVAATPVAGAGAGAAEKGKGKGVRTRTFTVSPPAIWCKRFGSETMSAIEKLLSRN
jgi:23S rRNA-/tRNA-specific pseudouridylate synthase